MPRNPAPAARALVQGFFRLHPEEAARSLERLSVREVLRLLEAQPASLAAALLQRLDPETASEVLGRMNEEVARQVLSALDPVSAATLLARLDAEVRAQRLSLLSPQKARVLEEIATYPADTAGGLMDPRVMIFRPDSTVREVLSRLRALHRKRVHDIFVADPERRLIGTIPIQDIAVSAPTLPLGDLIERRPLSVHALTPRDEVVELIGQFNLASLAVVDLEGRLLGVIRYGTLIEAAQEEVSADIQTMVGVSKEERALSKGWFAVRKRLPWLQINLATAFLAAAVVGVFEGTIAQFTALAVLLPVVAGQSGNTGAQALAVTMRGLALREIRTHQWPRVFLKELQVGLINGCVIAATTALLVFVWSQSFGLALVIGLAMVLSMVAAGLSGMGIPILLTTLGQDPAQSSSIVLTTITDVVGFLSFLGLATLLSGLL